MSNWCNECHRNIMRGQWKSCENDCPVFGLSFEDLAKQYLEAISKLKYLKDCAETVDKYEDDIFADYRYMAQSDMREIIDILLVLDFGEAEDPCIKCSLNYDGSCCGCDKGREYKRMMEESK